MCIVKRLLLSTTLENITVIYHFKWDISLIPNLFREIRRKRLPQRVWLGGTLATDIGLKIPSILKYFWTEERLLFQGTLNLHTLHVVVPLNVTLPAKGIQYCYYRSTDEAIQVQAGQADP